jgi:hypothetical protein
MLAWIPLLAAALASYGPVGLNYGFALYFLDYRHGFVKRGLIGEMFAAVRYLSRGQLLAVEYVFLAAGFALTYLVFRRVLFAGTAESRLAIILLSAPAALPHLGYLFAQPDITLYILVILSLAVFLKADARVATAVSLVLCCLGLLAHEAFLLMFYPAVVAVMMYLSRRGRLRLWAVGLHALVVLVCFVAVIHWGPLKVSPDVVLGEAQARTNVGIQRQVYDVMASTLAQQRALVYRMYSPGVIRMLWLTLALSAPYFALLARLLDETMRRAALPRAQRLLTVALFLSPLLLCTLGHDTTRWIGAMCLDATLFLLFVQTAEPAESPARLYLREWCADPAVLVWLAYFLAIGPYGATGLRTAEQLVGAWYGF